MTRWVDAPSLETISLESLGLPALVAQALIRRGITTPAAAQLFLNPDDSHSTPFPGMEKPAERILAAIDKDEHICVWGDFDVDGQTSTTVLVQTLQGLNAKVTYYIPIRATESHGLHIQTLKPVIDRGTKLLLTCDTGITAFESVDYARSRGLDVIITDHHELAESIPNSEYVLNPKLLPKDHTLTNLAGVGVAFKLAEALLSLRPVAVTTRQSLLDLVALGLIADVALLRGETRSLVQQGIEALRSTQRMGLKVMSELSDVRLSSLNEDTIAFNLAPRLNALGRLSDANPAVEFLLTSDAIRARVLANQIEGLNTQRKLMVDQVDQAAEAQFEADPSLLEYPVILLRHPSWPAGVLGIVASRLVERYHKPAILLSSSDNGILRGSARSVEGLHITEVIVRCKELLLGYGGHPMAAGLSLEAENFERLRQKLSLVIESMLGKAIQVEPTLHIDSWINLSKISNEFAKALEVLAPFGAGNPKLVFAARNLRLFSSSSIGKGKEHLKLVVEDQAGSRHEVLWWNGAAEELPSGIFDLAFTLRTNTYRSGQEIALEFLEFRIVAEKPLEFAELELEILDFRGRVEEFNKISSGKVAWAEGSDKKNGFDRYHLQPGDELIIWTTPPSPQDLRTVLDRVNPRRLYLFSSAPKPYDTEEFLEVMAGLTKFILKQRGGTIKLEELAAQTAQRESTIRLALAWLAAGGHIQIEEENGDLTLTAANGIADQYLMSELITSIKGLLVETSAYRAHFSTAPVDTLFPWRHPFGHKP